MKKKTVSFHDMRDPETQAQLGKHALEIHKSITYTAACLDEDFDAEGLIDWYVALLRTGKVRSE